MEGEVAWLVVSEVEGEALGRFDVDGVLARLVREPRAIVDFHEYAVQVHRMLHHGVIDQRDAHTLADA